MNLSFPLQHSLRSATLVNSAWRAPPFEFPKPKGKLTAAKAAGIRYQKKAEARLLESFPKAQLQPHFKFSTPSGTESCFPDALIDLGTTVVIVEIKLRHTYDGWFQLTHLYLPVLSKVYQGATFLRLEVCKNYDPLVCLPEEYELTVDPLKWVESSSRKSFAIAVWGK